jgi:hypothetical protein
VEINQARPQSFADRRLRNDEWQGKKPSSIGVLFLCRIFYCVGIGIGIGIGIGRDELIRSHLLVLLLGDGNRESKTRQKEAVEKYSSVYDSLLFLSGPQER